MRIVAITLALLFLPVVALADPYDGVQAMNVAMAQTKGEYTRSHRRQQQALWSVVLSELLDGADCVQTATRISHFNTVENNILTPHVIITEFHKDHPGLCIAGWSLINAAWYASTHKMDGFVQVPYPIIETLNLLEQAH